MEQAVTITKKLYDLKMDNLIQHRAVNQHIHYVPAVLHNVLVAQLVIEPVDTAVHLM